MGILAHLPNVPSIKEGLFNNPSERTYPHVVGARGAKASDDALCNQQAVNRPV